MAKTIKGNEIIVDDHLANAIKSGEDLIKVYIELDAQIKKTAKTAKAGLKTTDTNTAKGIREVNAEVTNSIKLRKAQIDINKKRQQLQREEIKTNDLIAKQTKRAIADKKKEDLADQKRLKTIRDSNSAYKKQSKELADLTRRYKDLAIAGRGSGKVARGLLVDIKKLNAGLVKADVATGKFGRNVGNYPKVLGKASAGLKQFAGALGLTSGIFLLVQGLKDAFNVFKDFEQANANLASILGTTKKNIAELTEDAKRLGAVSAFTASQITQLQTELAKLGFNRQEILDSTEAIQELAQATGTELAQSAVQVGSALRIFSLDATEAGRVSDVLAASTSKSALDMNKLATALPIVGSTAKAVGLNIERTTALLGVLSDRGIDASTSGTGLRNVFLELTKQGLTWEDAMLQINDSSNKAKTSLALFGKRGATVGLILAESGVQADELTTALENSGGTAQRMAKVQLDTLQGAVTKMSSAYEGFILSVESGDGVLSQFIITAIEGVTVFLNLISGIEQTDEQLKKLRFGDTIVKIKNFTEVWGKALNSLDDFRNALIDTVDILTTIITFGLIENVSEQYLGLEKNVRKLTDAQTDNFRTQKKGLALGKEVLKQQTKEITEAHILIEALQDENVSREDKNKAIAKLQADYPEILKNIDLETASTEQLTQAKKDLTKEILNQAIDRRKAQAIELVTTQILEAQLALVFDKNNASAKKKLDEGFFALQKIEQIATLVKGELGGVVDSLDFSEGFEDSSDKVTDLKNQLIALRKERRNAVSDAERGVIDKEIVRISQLLKDTQALNQKVLDDIFGKGNEDNKNIEKDGGSGGTSTKDVKTNKTNLNQQNTDFEDYIIRKENVENEFTNSQLERIDDEKNAVRDKYFILIEEGKKFVEEGKIDADELLLLEEGLQTELLAIDKKYADIKKAQDEKDRQDKLDADKKAQEELINNLKKQFDDLNNLLQISLDNSLKKIDLAIQKGQDKVTESEGRIDDLKAKADAGNADAQESIKAEKQALANEKESIAALEKKKRNLQILVTGLNLANQKIQSGDGNALVSASQQMGTFISSLKGFYKGTNTTLGAEMSNSFSLGSGDDSEIIRADKREMIVGVDNMAKMPNGITQDEVVRRVNLADNGMFQGVSAVKSYTNQAIFNDNRMVNAMSEVKQAINNIKIPEHRFNYNAVTKMATESMKLGNDVINNHSKIDNIF